jgi:hypothetical protein
VEERVKPEQDHPVRLILGAVVVVLVLTERTAALAALALSSSNTPTLSRQHFPLVLRNPHLQRVASKYQLLQQHLLHQKL